MDTKRETKDNNNNYNNTKCPFAFLKTVKDLNSSEIKCPFHKHVPVEKILGTDKQKIKQNIGLPLRGRTHVTSDGQAALLQDIGGGDTIREICTRFYAHAFRDQVISQFFFLNDGEEAHGKRLADWIIEKMGGEGRPWTDSGRYGQRQPSHHKAWYSDKRHSRAKGDHFKLDDVRIWMRLFFWSVRERGLAIHEPFWNWLVQFIAHFARVYDSQAPAYALESSEWSAKDENINIYLANDKRMADVINKNLYGGIRPYPPYVM